MKKLLRTSLMAMLAFAIFCGIDANAQVPNSFQKRIGYDAPGTQMNPMGNPYNTAEPFTFTVATPAQGYTLLPTVGFTYPFTSINQRSVAFSIPPILESGNGSVMMVYTKNEILGAGNSFQSGETRQITQIRLALRDTVYVESWGREPRDLNYEFWRLFLYYQTLQDLSFWASDPTAINIKMRNATTTDVFARGTNISTNLTTQSGWQNVWDGEWDHWSNDITIDTIGGITYMILVITLDTPFNYTGEDIWLAISNVNEEVNGESTSFFDGSIQDPFIYGFSCFETLDATAGRYLGPKFSGDRLALSWVSVGNLDLMQIVGPYTHNQFGQYTPVDNFYSGDLPWSNMSVRPRLSFSFPMMSTASNNTVDTIYKHTDTQYVAAINIKTVNSDYALKLTELTFNTTGTGTGVGINRARIYRSATGNTNLSDVQLIGTVTNLTGNVVFTPASAVPLVEGNNHFFIVYEIPGTNKCGDILGINVVNYKVGQRESAAFTGDLATHTVTVNTPKQIMINYSRVEITNFDNKNPIICFRPGENHTFNVIGTSAGGSLRGFYTGFRWERSTNGTTWQVITGATNSTLTFAKDLNYTYYRVTVLRPENCTPLNTDFVQYNIKYETPVREVVLNYTGGYSSDELEQLTSGAELTLVANLDVSICDSIAYTWQVRYRDVINHVWSPWSNDVVLTSAKTLPYKYDVTAATIPGDYEIRVSATSARTGGCADIVMSNTFTFSVKITDLKFDFVNQPEPKVTLCPSGTLNLMVSYYGIVVRGYWQKDGVPLQDTNNINNRFFTRSGLTFLDNGEYTYKVIAMVSDFNEATGEFVLVERPFVSAPCLLSINPRIELFDYPQTNNYANPGDMISLKVTSTYISNEYAHDPNYGYQWYKYVQGKGEVKLVDNKFFKGTRSNALVITDILSDTDSSAYTFNGDFYYIIITGPCNTITTRTRPIYLFPGDKLSVTQQLKNAVLCNVGDRAEFTATVDYAGNMNDLVYQWYLGGSPLSDGLSITGSKTNKLVIDPTDAADFDETIFCRVSLSTNPTVFANSNSVMITKKVLELVSKTPNVDTVKVKVADYLPELRITYNATPGSVCKVYGIFDGVAFPQPLWEFTATTLLNIADIPEGHLTDIEMFGFMIINDCGDTIKAEWYAQIVDDDGNVVENPNTVTEFTSLNSLSIAPNPVNDLVSISFNSDIETHTVIELTGLSGSSIATLSEGISVIGLNKLDFDLNNLGIATGTYLIRITTNRGTISKQFLFIK